MKKSILFTLMIGLFILVSCVKTDSSEKENQILDDCIVAPIAYPVLTPIPDDVGSAIYLNPELTEIAPSSSWELITTMEGGANDFIVQDNNVWFASNPIRSYNTKNGTWNTYATISDQKGYPQRWFISRDGTLWGYNVIWDSNLNGQIITRYNATRDKFEIVEDQSGFLNKVFSVKSNIVEDQKGVLWMFVQKMDEVAFYSLNPQTLEIQQHFALINGTSYDSLAIQPNGNLWFVDIFGGYLSYYDPESNEIHTYEGYPNVNDLKKMGSIYRLYFDDNNRLWIDNIGWLDLTNPDEPIWYSILEVPEFSTNNILPPNYIGYLNVPASKIFQSSNGKYWFTSEIGIVRLDLEEQEWCHITTGMSSVVEDNKHNLWILIYGKLYKRNLNQ